MVAHRRDVIEVLGHRGTVSLPRRERRRLDRVEGMVKVAEGCG